MRESEKVINGPAGLAKTKYRIGKLIDSGRFIKALEP